MLKKLVTRHLELTGSQRAGWVLDHWQEAQSRFVKVFPHEFKRVLGVPRAAARAAMVGEFPLAQTAEAQHG